MSAPFITAIKVKEGFEFVIGSASSELVIARARWVKSKGVWLLRAISMEKCDEKSFGVLALTQWPDYYKNPLEIIEALRAKANKKEPRP